MKKNYLLLRLVKRPQYINIYKCKQIHICCIKHRVMTLKRKTALLQCAATPPCLFLLLKVRLFSFFSTSVLCVAMSTLRHSQQAIRK
jgi:hypothetical protein